MKNTSSTFLTRVRMARILFLFSVCFLSLHSYAANIGAYAQQKNLTIEMRNKTVKEVLDYIEKNSEFIFFYYSKAIDTKRIVSLSVKDQPITVILDQLFKNTDVLYEIKDRQVSLKREELPTEPTSAGFETTKAQIGRNRYGCFLPAILWWGSVFL